MNGLLPIISISYSLKTHTYQNEDNPKREKKVSEKASTIRNRYNKN